MDTFNIKSALKKARYMNKKPMGKKQLAEVFKGVMALNNIKKTQNVRFNDRTPPSIGDILKGMK